MCQLNIYWIYSANSWEIYDSLMMLGNVHFLEFACIIYPPDIPYLFPRYSQVIPMTSPYPRDKCMVICEVLYEGFKNTMTFKIMSLPPMRIVHR